MSFTVLLFGLDEQLLTIRMWVLQSQGFQVQTVSNIDAAIHILSTQKIDLLLLCHSVPDKDFKHVLAFAHSLNPQMKVLAMDFDGSRGDPGEEVTIISNYFEGGAMVKAVEQALRPKSGSPPLEVFPLDGQRNEQHVATRLRIKDSFRSQHN
jgi:DNA-binding NtrC family response regulator